MLPEEGGLDGFFVARVEAYIKLSRSEMSGLFFHHLIGNNRRFLRRDCVRRLKMRSHGAPDGKIFRSGLLDAAT